MYISAEYARLKNATNYRDMVSIYYYHPTVNKIALFLWDILIFMAAITVSASCTAGTGSLLQDVFGNEIGLPTRSAVGMNVLPGNIAVEIEALVSYK